MIGRTKILEIENTEKLKNEISELVLRKNMLELRLQKPNDGFEDVKKALVDKEFELKMLLMGR